MLKRGKHLEKKFNKETSVKMDKKGQVAIFILVALVILAAITFLYTQGYVLPLSQQESQSVLSAQVEPVRRLIARCIETSSSKALETLGQNAGYYDTLGLKKIDFAGDKIVVAQKLNNAYVNRLPSTQEVEENFKNFMEREGYTEIEKCADFSKLDIGVSRGEKNIAAKIQDNQIEILVDWPITLRKGRARLEVQQQNVVILTKTGKVLRLANDVVNREISQTPFQGENVDKFISDSSLQLRDIDLTIQNYPTSSQSIIFIESKASTSEKGEKEFKFYFVIDRS